MTDIALALGANLGDKKHNILLAIHLLIKNNIIFNVICSTFLTNKALLPNDAPDTWNLDFINCIIIGKTKLDPQQLLDKILNIETQLGRAREKKWQPRTIDIDILLYGTSCFHKPNLIIPHYDLLNRHFFLKPLNEIAPQWIFPGQGPYHNMTINQIEAKIYGTHTISP